MTRNADGTWTLTSRMVMLVGFLIPIFGSVANIYISSKGIEREIQKKVDSREYIAGRDSITNQIAKHIEQNNLVIQHLMLVDSTVISQQTLMLNRLTEICRATRAGCR